MKIVLVGAGLAAQRCAESLRALGHDGPIAMYGDRIIERHTTAPLVRVLTPNADGTFFGWTEIATSVILVGGTRA